MSLLLSKVTTTFYNTKQLAYEYGYTYYAISLLLHVLPYLCRFLNTLLYEYVTYFMHLLAKKKKKL